ncbi:DUF484 family protein [Xanthomonadaceae bacterium JHOS43]|nr:DUF484 family protein [Xanthomonadaceae bacterium JHOS43]MCX7562451.1 DUF484 family protein [Xanthomonadaceae bacterium XH05]
MSDTPRHELSATDIAAWLREHPTFFLHHPDVAMDIELPRQNGPATSLASYQLDVLREKNRELNRRLQELFAIANENERLTVRTHQFTLALLRARTLSETLSTLVAMLREDFSSEWVRVLLLGPRGDVPESPWWRVLPKGDAALEPFAAFLATDEALCGRLQPRKLDALFGDEAGKVASTALLPLGRYGLLAIGCSDPNRFYPGMGTLFLRLMSEALVAALARFDA